VGGLSLVQLKRCRGTFHPETRLSLRKSADHSSNPESRLFPPISNDIPTLALALSLLSWMIMNTATVQGEREGPLRDFLAVVRELAEASIVIVAFAFAILMLGLPVALALRAVHDIVSLFVGSL
jgi:hypothetical protein